jgi:hypothetical protein
VGESRPPRDRTGTTGTGQHSTTAPQNGKNIGKNVLSPADSTGKAPPMSSSRRNEPDRPVNIAPATGERYTMIKDSGPKTAREREVNQAFNPQFKTAYELQLKKLSQNETGAETGYRAKKAQ